MSNNSIQVAIKRNSNLKDETLISILDAFTEINPTWLLTGKGEMILKDKPTKKDEENYKFIKELRELNEDDQKQIINTLEALISHAKNK